MLYDIRVPLGLLVLSNLQNQDCLLISLYMQCISESRRRFIVTDLATIIDDYIFLQLIFFEILRIWRWYQSLLLLYTSTFMTLALVYCYSRSPYTLIMKDLCQLLSLFYIFIGQLGLEPVFKVLVSFIVQFLFVFFWLSVGCQSFVLYSLVLLVGWVDRKSVV